MARITDFGVVGNDVEILHPKHKNRWKVIFNMGSDTQALTLQAITVDRPKVEFEEITLDRYNSRAYIAGKHTFQPINITFEDDIGGQTTTIIQRQIEKQQHIIGVAPARLLGAAPSGNKYKFHMEMLMLDGDYNGENILENWNLEGAWFQNIDYTDLDYAASETVKITVAIRYDHAFQIIGGIEGRATGGIAGGITGL